VHGVSMSIVVSEEIGSSEQSTPSNLLLSLSLSFSSRKKHMLWISTYFLDFIGSNLDSVE
jgi:hypothetical protein